jgi:aminomethyltransferase
MAELLCTPLHETHVRLGAKMVEFGGWEMPVQYPAGIIAEHLATRRGAGLFDVSHMGRFVIRGRDALAFLQRALTTNVDALDPGMSAYCFIASDSGGAVDDAYLYRFVEDEYLLVVNASNRLGDWDHLQRISSGFADVRMTDETTKLAMISLQGPLSRGIVEGVAEGPLPEPRRNALGIVTVAGTRTLLGRTGYTGEPLCFELFVPSEKAGSIWEMLTSAGATPVGLGARDTLRLEASLPLYGHELGVDADGVEIPLWACPLARFAVSFAPAKGEYVGRAALARQREAWARILERDYSDTGALPRLSRSIALIDRGVARQGASVFKGGQHVGYVTSGTTVPLWTVEGEGLASRFTDQQQLRSIAIGLLDAELDDGDEVEIEVRGRNIPALIVPYHLRSEAPPYARPIVVEHFAAPANLPTGSPAARLRTVLDDTLANTLWRQRQCINLIPSEMTTSPMVRLVSEMDPAFRYAEHRPSRAFYDAEIFYYQGTDFIHDVELQVEAEMMRFLGARAIEARLLSGQMANATVFSAMVDWLNRADRKSEPRRIRCVMNNNLGAGGHLSAQPMGALRDYVAHDPRTERPAVVNFAVMADNPYRIDVPASLALIEEYRPELIVLGKSMVLHPEPVAEIRRFLDERGTDAVLMYDMAHVLGLVGPHFQQPFLEGADIVTGSTHKTFFGTQRGVVAGHWEEGDDRYPLWEAVNRRAFPGAVSNHHLGTLLGLLVATMEMNEFGDAYQQAVVANAKAFARALRDAGLQVAGDPAVGYTETHQVVVEVGYGRGPEVARRLEDNNIVCNYQATPDEEGFTAAGALRLGVAEMTRFGMGPTDFAEVAGLMADVVLRSLSVKDQVKGLRSRFLNMRYCFPQEDHAAVLAQLRDSR